MLKLAWKNTIDNPLNLLIGLILFALGIGLISYLLLLNTQLKEKFESNLADIDLVIGAKGSPLQLILCNMYHIDNPTGNINIEDAKPFLNPKHPLIKLAVPLSLGDNYRGYRIVGTSYDILKLYNGEVSHGRLYEKDLEVTIGKQVADATGLTIGSTFMSSHGMMEDDDLAHDHANLKVVGILKPTGNVIDQLILTNTSTVWAVHDHEEGDHEDHSHEDHAHHDHDHDNSTADLLNHPDKQITSILIQYKSKTNFQALSLPRNINENTNLQAASPAYQINKLRDMIGIGTEGIRVIAFLIAFVSAISIFISLFRSMKERKYELALMRVMGGSRTKLFMLVIFEGLILTIIGWILGTLLAHIGIEITGKYLVEDFRYAFSGFRFLNEEWIILGVSLLIGYVASVIPAIQASRTDINKTLSKG
jgi:putative ABC transport system permease protein